MKVAIFGACGFVGQNIADTLKANKIDFVASDITESKFDKSVEYMKADLLKIDEVKKVINGCDIVVHLAAHPLQPSIQNPILNAKINIEGTLNLMNVSRELGVKNFIFSSASSLYGEVKENKVKEDNLLIPKTPYAVTKVAVEHYLRVYKELYGLNYLVFRFFNIYGPYQMPETGGLVPNILKKIHNNEPITVFGDGSAARDFTFIPDVADFYVKAIKQNVNGMILNMGTGELTTIKQLVIAAGKATGKEPKIDYQPARPGEISNFSADTSLLKKAFGSIPSTSLADGLTRTYNWLKKAI